MEKEIELSLKELIAILRKSIEHKRLVEFYYKSISGKREWRTIRPYILIPRGTNIEFVGLPLEELTKPLHMRQPGHYTITKLNTGNSKYCQKDSMTQAFLEISL
jgi:hypothetical protein